MALVPVGNKLSRGVQTQQNVNPSGVQSSLGVGSGPIISASSAG